MTKYETPELTALTPAINAIQGGSKVSDKTLELSINEASAAYQDWE
jgi:hypothetical protein